MIGFVRNRIAEFDNSCKAALFAERSHYLLMELILLDIILINIK